MVLNRNKRKKLAQTNNTVKYERAYEEDRICINGSYKTNLDLEIKKNYWNHCMSPIVQWLNEYV
ncbi:hypothetical protein [Staphylococcus capitis]|uniref:hypothetical protein n=1 Tax=Staphylococcus capitis TaxID=29388 RepID=UPI0019C2F6F3|nr:hypothetical protein [Staphylococcus capitis]GGI37085.1 hypothetical protein GCM10008141_15820 [Staphylococcus capitis]